MLWAQVFPFVALLFYSGDEKNEKNIVFFLVGSFTLWVLLTVTFFCSINLNYIHTFFSLKTAPQYTVELYEEGEEDYLL